MDQTSRHRARGIRTIGRLPSLPSDDLLLAQWPAPAGPAHQRQDIAISSAWSRPALPPTPATRTPGAGELGNFEYLVAQYEDHQQRVIQRLLETIDAEIDERDTLPLAFDPPPAALDTVLAALDQAIRYGDLSGADVESTRARLLRLGESVARLWALVDLHRSGHITRNELRQKRDLVIETDRREAG
jgi:hypothetical protein